MGIINGALVLLLGLLWALESILGKLILIHNASTFDFPLMLNLGTVVAILLLCLHPKYMRIVCKLDIVVFMWMVLVALSLVFIPYCILYLSLREITPAEASLITSLTPVFSLLFGMIILRTRIRVRSLIALVIGIIGVLLMIIPQLNNNTANVTATWYTIMLLVPLSYAASGYCLKKCAECKVSYIQLLLVTNLVSAGLFLVLNNGFPILYGERESIICIFGIGINISAIVLMLFISGRINPLALSFSNYTTLMFSFILSTLIFSQYFSLLFIISIILIVVSSLIAQEKK